VKKIAQRLVVNMEIMKTQLVLAKYIFGLTNPQADFLR
jgi:hypothetical protein